MIESKIIQIESFTLSNNIKVHCVKKEQIPVVTLTIGFPAGAKDDLPGKSGTAHLLEHLMFENGPDVNANNYDDLLHFRGGNSNAFTNQDYTIYIANIPSSSIEFLLWLEKERFSDFRITEDSFRIQKSVVTEERSMYYDNAPYGTAFEQASAYLFEGTVYRTPVIGYRDEIQTITLQDVKDFYEKNYDFGNSVIAVVGDIEVSKMQDLLEKYFGGFYTGSSKIPEYYVSEQSPKSVEKTFADNISLPGEFIYYRTPGFLTREYFALQMITELIAGGESSELFKVLVRDEKHLQSIESYLIPYRYAGLFTIEFYYTKDGKKEIIDEKFMNYLEIIEKGLIPARAVEKARNKILTEYYQSLQLGSYLAERITEISLMGKSADFVFNEYAGYQLLSSSDITEVSRTFLSEDKKVELNYIPNVNIE
ncbi:MAG: M16 family metallopeptidase [Ignavibacteria bacterium]